AMAGSFFEWLLKHKVDDMEDFINSSSSALILCNESTICSPTDEFRIPAFIVFEELMEEFSKNIISPKLRAFLIHPLSLFYHDNTISERNYNEKLHEYLNRQYLLPEDVRNPLAIDGTFHVLPPSIKLWIFTSLLTNSGRNIIPIEQKSIGHDNFGNEYYLIDGGHLYIKYGKALQDKVEKVENNESNPGNRPCYSLEDHIRKSSNTTTWKLLSSSKEELDIAIAFLRRQLKY
ncbi:hypothetical protein PFISCL1PPCAC_1143, partial [Pristionchus fissidentatus]